MRTTEALKIMVKIEELKDKELELLQEKTQAQKVLDQAYDIYTEVASTEPKEDERIQYYMKRGQAADNMIKANESVQKIRRRLNAIPKKIKELENQLTEVKKTFSMDDWDDMVSIAYRLSNY